LSALALAADALIVPPSQATRGRAESRFCGLIDPKKIKVNQAKSRHFETILFHAKINPAQPDDFRFIVKVRQSHHTSQF
jgi:hypothetical protein